MSELLFPTIPSSERGPEKKPGLTIKRARETVEDARCRPSSFEYRPNSEKAGDAAFVATEKMARDIAAIAEDEKRSQEAKIFLLAILVDELKKSGKRFDLGMQLSVPSEYDMFQSEIDLFVKPSAKNEYSDVIGVEFVCDETALNEVPNIISDIKKGHEPAVSYLEIGNLQGMQQTKIRKMVVAFDPESVDDMLAQLKEGKSLDRSFLQQQFLYQLYVQATQLADSVPDNISKYYAAIATELKRQYEDRFDTVEAPATTDNMHDALMKALAEA